MKKALTLTLASALLTSALAGCGTASNNHPELTTQALGESIITTATPTTAITEKAVTTGTTDTSTQTPAVNFAQLFEGSDTSADVVNTYLAVLNNKVKIQCEWDEDELYLSNCSNPNGSSLIGDLSQSRFTVVDMDNDGIMEVLVSGTVVLHYEDGMVYGYAFSFRNMYYVKTDGSFFWNGGAGSRYGCAKLNFNKESVTWTDIYRVETDETNSEAYYIGEQQVTKEEFLECSKQKEDIALAEWYGLKGIAIPTEIVFPQ